MNYWINRFVLNILFAVVVIFMSSCSGRTRSINRLESFTEELVENGKDYDQKDWDEASAKYEQIIADLNEYRGEYTDEELHEIGKLKGKCAVQFARAAVNQFGGILQDLTKEAAGFVEGASGTLLE